MVSKSEIRSEFSWSLIVKVATGHFSPILMALRYVPGRVTFYMVARLCEDPGTD